MIGAAAGPATGWAPADARLLPLLTAPGDTTGPLGCTLWLADLTPPPAPERAGWWAPLAPGERARAERFRAEVHGWRYVVGRHLLRRLLARRTGRAPAEVTLDEGAHGKPGCSDAGAGAFNLSHADATALLAFAPAGAAAVGVDLEPLAAMPDADALAATLFTDAERAALALLPPPARDAGFLRIWTRKEACLKALGCGLSIEPARVHVGLDGERVRLPAPGGEVEVVLASFAPQPGWVAAVALQPA